MLVTGCSSAGKVGGSEIYKGTQKTMISMRGPHPGGEDKVSEIKKLLTCGTFYFTWSATEEPMDLTLSCQKSGAKTDNRFFWNRLTSSFLTLPQLTFTIFNRMCFVPFIRHGIDADSWLLKVMCGSVEVRTVYVGSKQAKAAVISRLSSERAGTR